MSKTPMRKIEMSLSDSKLQLIAQLLETDFETVSRVYHNVPNKAFIVEQKQLFEQLDISVRLGYSILAVIDRASRPS